MAGEKAKENTKLVANCAACGKELSVELLTGMIQGSGRKRSSVPVCRPCLDQGWPAEKAKPPEPDPGGEVTVDLQAAAEDVDAPATNAG